MASQIESRQSEVEVIQGIFQELNYQPVSISELSTIEKIKRLFAHLKEQIRNYPGDQTPELFSLTRCQQLAVEKFRSIDEIRGLTDPQAEALAFFPLAKEQVDHKWFGSWHFRALKAGRSYEEIQGIVWFKAEALALPLKLTRSQIDHKWFGFWHFKALKAGRSYEEIQGLVWFKAATLASCSELARSQIDCEWFKEDHFNALKVGIRYEEIQGLAEDQARALFLEVEEE